MKRLSLIFSAVWRWFCCRSLFVQALIIVPVLCAVILDATVGNMGLAAMGGAVGVSALVVGWLIGLAAMVLGKAGVIVAKDRRRVK